MSHVRYTCLPSALGEVAKYLILIAYSLVVLYFSSVNCEIRSRLVFIRKVNVFQNANPGLYNIEHSFRSYFDSCSIISTIKVECTLLQDHCKFKFYIINFNKETKPAHVTYNANLRRNTLAM